MTFIEFIYFPLIVNKVISLNVLELVLLLLTLGFGAYFQFRAKKTIYNRLSKKKDDRGFVRFLYSNIVILLWSSMAISVFSLLIVDFWSIQVLGNWGFRITSFDILVVVSSFAVAILFQKYLKVVFYDKYKDKDNQVKASPLVFNVLLWLVFTSITLRSFLAEYEKFADYSLFSVKEVDVTLSDFFYMFAVIAVTALVLLGMKRFFRRQTEKGNLDLGTSSALFQVGKYILWILALITILQGAGFQLSILLAGSAALLVGLGLGIQQIFGDIASGFILLIERTIKVSDVVDVGGVVGKVVNSGIRTTTILTRDHVRMIIPNSKFTSEPVVNFSHFDENTRFKVNIGVAYGSDIQLVKKILLECAALHKEITMKEQPFVRFKDFGNSSLDFQLFFWTERNFEVENIQSDLRFMIDEKFREHNITIPFPQRDVHMIS